MKNACERCLMPFSQDDGVREDERYCSYCYKDGELQGADLTLAEFKAMTFEQMRKKGIGPIRARFYTYMIGFAPYWKQQ